MTPADWPRDFRRLRERSVRWGARRTRAGSASSAENEPRRSEESRLLAGVGALGDFIACPTDRPHRTVEPALAQRTTARGLGSPYRCRPGGLLCGRTFARAADPRFRVRRTSRRIEIRRTPSWNGPGA